MRILAICGSLQSQSGNLSLLQVATTSAPLGVGIVVFDGLRDLPHFNPDLEASGDAPPPAVVEWRRALSESDALLIATPEYGHSLPGALKNAIDWVIGSGELGGKVVGITAAVPSLERGRRGLGALRDTLGAVRATVVGGEPIAKGPSFEAEVMGLVSAIVASVEWAGPGASATGTFDTPVGATAASAAAPGKAYELTVSAKPGERLSFATMFGMSNDWFFGTAADGLALFDATGTPRRGDVTHEIFVFDAGTEIDQVPAIGADTGPQQSSPDQGANDPIRQVRLVSPGTYAPTASAHLRVTLTPM